MSMSLNIKSTNKYVSREHQLGYYCRCDFFLCHFHPGLSHSSFSSIVGLLLLPQLLLLCSADAYYNIISSIHDGHSPGSSAFVSCCESSIAVIISNDTTKGHYRYDNVSIFIKVHPPLYIVTHPPTHYTPSCSGIFCAPTTRRYGGTLS